MVRKKLPDSQQTVSLFMRNIWFYAFFFFLLLMIASFGLIAEASVV
jgi:hypothetical protein